MGPGQVTNPGRSARQGLALAAAVLTVMFAAWPATLSGAAPPPQAPSLGPLPVPCTARDLTPAHCLVQSRAGSLSITPHIVHPGGQFTVDFGAVEAYHDYWDIGAMGLPGRPEGGCKPLQASCTFQVPLSTVPTNQYVVYTVSMNTVQGPAISNDYLAVVGRRALTGSVLDPSGKGVQGAELSLVGPNGEQTTSTDAHGDYGVVLAVGTYTVSVVEVLGSDQSAKISHCSGRVQGSDCVVDLESADGTASFTEGGVRVTEVRGPESGPASGAIGGGSPITVTGSGFGKPGSHDQVDLVPVDGGAPIGARDVVVVDNSTIRAVTESSKAELGDAEQLVTDVEVTAGGVTSAPNPPGDQFTYVRPTIRHIDPSAVGSPAGGTELTITGRGFDGPHSGVFVRFCPPGTLHPIVDERCADGRDPSTGAPVIYPDDDTTLKVIAPASPVALFDGSGTASVFVGVTPKEGGPIDSSTGYPYTYAVAVESIDPPTGVSPAGGTELTFTGHGFGGPHSGVFVRFCPPGTLHPLVDERCADGHDPRTGSPTIYPDDDTSLKVIAPASPVALLEGTGTASVVVGVTPKGGGPIRSSAAYPYNYAVAVASIDPTSISPAGGTELTITGHGFGGPHSFVSVVFCPAGTASPVGDKLCDHGHSTDGSSDSIYPGSDTSFKVVAPPTPIDLVNGTGTASVFVEVFPKGVGGPENRSSAAYPYTYGVAVQGIDPPTGSPAGGTELTITGHGFGGPHSFVNVEFCPAGTASPVGNKLCHYGHDLEDSSHEIYPDNDTAFQVVAPRTPVDLVNGTGTVSVFVEVFPKEGGPGNRSASSPYTYGVAVQGIDPPTGSPAGGTELTITGHGFGGPYGLVNVEFCPILTASPVGNKNCHYGHEPGGSSKFIYPDSDTTFQVIAPKSPVALVGGTATVLVFVEVFPKGGGPGERSIPVSYGYR